MDGYVTIGTQLDTKKFDRQIEQVEEELKFIEEQLSKPKEYKLSSREIADLNIQAEKLNNKLITLRKRQQDINKIDFSNLNRGMSNVIKKVARWSLAIFGIRSAYMAVRNAINVISQDDEQLKADIDYIKSALAYTLEPVVRAIVNLAKQLMFYIGYIIQSWTGKNIFENANKSLKGAVGQATKLSKILAGFDEMNILQDNSSSGSGGGVTPSFDLTNLQNMDVPRWVRWIAGVGGNKLKAILAAIASALVAIKLGLTAIKAFGVGLAIYGIITAIQSLIRFLKDPTFDNFTDTIKGITLAVTGVALAVGAWPVAFAGAMTYIVVQLVKHLDEVKKTMLNFNGWLDKNVLGWLKEWFGPLGELIYIPFKNAVLFIENLFVNLLSSIKTFINGVVKLFKGDLIGGIKDMFKGFSTILITPIQTFYNSAKNMIKEIIGLFKDLRNTSIGGGGSFSISYGGGGGGRAKGGIYYPKLAVGGIINQPGRGVPYHGATIAERGAEAVLPLTDSQQMALLGEAIGKYITINAQITNTMNGRVISKELQRVQNGSDFAYNR